MGYATELRLILRDASACLIFETSSLQGKTEDFLLSSCHLRKVLRCFWSGAFLKHGIMTLLNPTGNENTSRSYGLTEATLCTCLVVIHVQLFTTLWIVACQAALSMEFSRQEYWSGLPFPSPWGLPNPETELRSPALQVDTLLPEPPGKPRSHIAISKLRREPAGPDE